MICNQGILFNETFTEKRIELEFFNRLGICHVSRFKLKTIIKRIFGILLKSNRRNYCPINIYCSACFESFEIEMMDGVHSNRNTVARTLRVAKG